MDPVLNLVGVGIREMQVACSQQLWNSTNKTQRGAFHE